MTRRCIRLAYTPPYDFAASLAFFARRAIDGIERVDARGYRRCFAIGGTVGILHVRRAAGHALQLELDCPRGIAWAPIRDRVRRLFDLDLDVRAMRAHLDRQVPLRALLRRHPGQRVPGAWDGFEIAVRAVLGQQVSVAAARTLTVRLVQRFGTRVTSPDGAAVRLFPSPERLAEADLGALGLTRARARTLNEVARAVVAGAVDFDPGQPLEHFVARWTQVPGIGPWTAHYIAMRALGHADAFPAADLVLRKALANGGDPLLTARLQAMAEAWRPWRAYAVLQLWRSQG